MFRLGFAVLLAAALAAPGCKRDAERDDSATPVMAAVRFSSHGFAAIQYAPVYEFTGGEVEWIGVLDFGEALAFDMETAGLTSTPEKYVYFEPPETAIDEKWVYLIPVMGKELRGWISRSAYAPEDARTGTVIGSEIVLEDGESLRPGDLVVFDPRETATLIAPFGNRYYFDQADNLSKISFNTEDVEAAKLLAKASVTRNSERARELLREAAEQYPGSALRPLIEERLRPTGQAGLPQIESLAAMFSVAADDTAVHEAPDFSSAVSGRLEQFAEVITLERTAALAETEAGSARWYHISAPMNGWVFGLGLEGAD